MNTIAVANAALDFLKGRTWHSKTKKVYQELLATFPSLTHADLRTVLNRLHKCGILDRKGIGSFEWKMLVLDWDRSWPFKNHPDTKDNTPKPVYDDPPHTHTHNTYYSPPKPEMSNTVTEALVRSIAELMTKVSDLTVKLEEAEKKILVQGGLLDDVRTMKQSFVRELTIKRYDNKQTVKLKNKILPKVYERVLSLAQCRRNILLVGPAGCGKTYLAKLIADSLGLDFAALSCTAGMSESHLLGRAVPDLTKGKNRFQGTDFLKIYENGGVALLDEFDAADPNLLLCVNSGLANGYMNVPNRPDDPLATRHPDFVCIATANTFGRGATRMYAGRNQLDEATIDRFRIGIVECDYDLNVENAICPDIGGQDGKSYRFTPTNGSAYGIERIVDMGYNLRETCHYIRHKIDQTGMRRIMSSRFMEDAYVMMEQGGWSLNDVLLAYFEGWTAEERAKIF
jgi:hypothetical protein